MLEDIYFKHRLQLARRPGQYDQEFFTDPDQHPYRGAVRVRQNIGSLNNKRLPFVDLRHFTSPAKKPSAQISLDLVMINERTLDRLRRDLTSEVVFGRPEPARRNYNIGPLHSIANSFLKTHFVITDDRLELDLDTDIVKFFRKPKTICIRPLRCQQL